MILLTTASASYVNVIEPFNGTVNNNGTIFLGKVGPGQTFYITVSSATTNNTGTLINYGWNQLLASDVPSGWTVANSSLNNQLLSVKIRVAPNAPNGTYAFNLTAVNLGNYSKIGVLRFRALINVTPDVFRLNVSPTQINTGPGQPSQIYVTINNTGVSDSPFIITAQGLPALNISKSVIALHHTQENFTYPLYEDEPGQYQAVINVSSSSSPLVHKTINVNLTVQASLLSDYQAIGQGSLAFPIIYEPAYAIMHLISYLFGA